VKDWLFELGSLTLIGAAVFILMLGWKEVAAAELIKEKVYTIDEDGRYFVRLSWTPKPAYDIRISADDIGVIKAEIGIWLN